MSTSESKSALVLELAEEFLERYRQGERPPLREYTDRHPELADEIREVFPAMAMLERIGIADASLDDEQTQPKLSESKSAPLSQLGDYRIIREVGHGGMGVVYEAEQLSLGRHVALKVLPGHGLLNATYLERFRREAKAAARLHHSNIVPVFGTGDVDGTHYYAMQFIRGDGLDRVLRDLRGMRQAGEQPKTPQPGDKPDFEPTASIALGKTPGKAAPARSEELSDADMPAKSSVSGLSATSHSGIEFYRSAAKIGIQVADALSYAHGQGILHRDVKPSNLLLDTKGTVWVTDFGLAKADGDDLTHTGDIVGTIRYMAPERFDGHSLPQSDIYSLGITLYELLALRPPFDGVNRARLIEQVLHSPVPRLRKFDPHVPRDLETIVLKCVAKNPAERYATAERLADDLRRFLAGQTIVARPVGTPERAWKWAVRNKALSASLAGVALTLVIGTVVSVAFAMQAGRDAGRADANQRRAADEAARASANEALARQRADEALAAKDQANRSRYISDMRLIAELRTQTGASPRTIADRLAEHVPTQPGDTDYRDFAWRLYWTELNRSALGFTLREPPVAIAIDRDGHLVTLDRNGRVRLIDVDSGKPIRTFATADTPQSLHDLSRDGRTLARTGAKSNELALFDVDSGALIRTITCIGSLRGVTLSRDGQFVACVLTDDTAAVHRVQDGEQLGAIKLQNSFFRCSAISDDGQRFVLGNHPNLGQSTVYDLKSNSVVFKYVSSTVLAIAFAPDGKSVASSYLNGSINLFDSTTGMVLRSIPPTNNTIYHVAYTSDGTRIVASGSGGFVALIDPQHTRPTMYLQGHAETVGSIGIANDAKRIITVDLTGLVRVWDPSRPTTIRRCLGDSRENVWQIAIAADGQWLAAMMSTCKVQLVDARSMTLIREFDPGDVRPKGVPWPVPSVALAANKSLIACGNFNSQVTVWDPATARLLWKSPIIPLERYGRASSVMPINAPMSKRGVSAVEFSPEGGLLAIGHGSRTASVPNYDQEVTVWNTKDWSRVATLKVRNTVSRLQFTRDSQELIAASHDGSVRTWRRGEKSWADEMKFDGDVTSLGLSTDDKWLAIGLFNGALHLRNRTSGQSFQRKTAHDGIVSAVSFSPDGRTIATSGRRDQLVKLWDAATLREVYARRSGSAVHDQRFSPSGDMLFGCFADGAWVFPAAPLADIDRERGLGWPTDITPRSPQ